MELYKLLKDRQKVVSMTRTEQMVYLLEYKGKCLRKMAEATIQEGLYCNITWDGAMCWDQTPAGQTATQHCADYINLFNRHGFAKRECLPDGTWKPQPNSNMTDGWSDFSDCLVNRTTTYNNNLDDHLYRIQMISDIGYGISLAALIIAELIMLFSKRLHCKSNTLHINLFFAFILRASTAFIQNQTFVQSLGFEKDIIRRPGGMAVFNPEGTHWECKLLMTVFMYALNASQMWIFVEGLYLHMLVYRTLFTERHGIRLYVFLGWGLPLIYLIPWVFVRIFLDDELCWNIYKQHHYVWIIKGPMVLAVLVNSVFFVSIVLVLCRRVKFHRYPQGSSQHFRKIAKFAIVLIPLFGVIHLLFTPFPTGLDQQVDIFVLYCEMTYNSIQGFILALLFCFLNEEVQNRIRHWCYRRRLNGFSARTMYMSSVRTNQSRTAVSRDPVNIGGAACNGEKNDELSPLKWKSSRKTNGNTISVTKEEIFKEKTGYNKITFQEVEGSSCTIDTV